MSSTLFGRGTMTQVGGAYRTEQINRELGEIRALLTELRELPGRIRELADAVAVMEARLTACNVPELATAESAPSQAITREEIDELATRIEAVRVLQSGPVATPSMIAALERRLEAKIKECKESKNIPAK